MREDRGALELAVRGGDEVAEAAAELVGRFGGVVLRHGGSEAGGLEGLGFCLGSGPSFVVLGGWGWIWCLRRMVSAWIEASDSRSAASGEWLKVELISSPQRAGFLFACLFASCASEADAGRAPPMCAFSGMDQC